jgi:hypothetical protein
MHAVLPTLSVFLCAYRLLASPACLPARVCRPVCLLTSQPVRQPASLSCGLSRAVATTPIVVRVTRSVPNPRWSRRLRFDPGSPRRERDATKSDSLASARYLGHLSCTRSNTPGRGLLQQERVYDRRQRRGPARGGLPAGRVAHLRRHGRRGHGDDGRGRRRGPAARTIGVGQPKSEFVSGGGSNRARRLVGSSSTRWIFALSSEPETWS